MKTLLVASLIASFAIASAVAELPSVHSDFSDGTVDGWKFYAGGDPGSSVAPSSMGENTHHLKLTEGAIGGKDFFDAPAKFTGDKAIYYGGTLSFDIRVSDASSPTTWRDDVVLIGANNTRLIHTFSSRPTVAWGSRTISLEIGDWYFDTASHNPTASSDGWAWNLPATPPRLATEAEIRGVLADVKVLLIKADHRAGAETVYLDNVTMIASVPEPGTSVLILGGAALAAAFLRRRKQA